MFADPSGPSASNRRDSGEPSDANPAKAIEAWSGTDFTQALEGLVVEVTDNRCWTLDLAAMTEGDGDQEIRVLGAGLTQHRQGRAKWNC